MAVRIIDNTIHSVKIIVYRESPRGLEFVILKEPEGLYSFPGGAQEEGDAELEGTARREIFEEIGLRSRTYALQATHITHEFMHTDEASPRFGKKGLLHIFLAKYNGKESIRLHNDLQEYSWESAEQVMQKLEHAYPYLKTVFAKALSLLDN